MENLSAEMTTKADLDLIWGGEAIARVKSAASPASRSTFSKPTRYLYIVGRDKDVIISGGYNVYPREVELALEKIDGVAEAAVFGVEHPDYGEAVVAAVRVTAPTLDGEKILAAVKHRLASYKCPKKIVAMPEIPRNELGKILKSDLKTWGLVSFAG